MENLKTSLRSSARALSLTVISQQLVFQSLTGVLMVLAILIGFSFDSSLYLFSDIAMLISSCIFLFLLKGNLKEQNPQKGKVTLADFAKWFIIILGVNCFLSAIDTAFNLATGLSLTFPSESTTASPLLLLLTVGVFPAIAEELIFRGIVYRYLRRFGTVFAAFASSLIFGLIHLNVLQTLFAFCLGLVLCRAYEKSGKLIYPMLLHFMNNSLMVLLTVLPIDAQITKTAECTMGIAAFIAGVIYLKRNKKAFSVKDGNFAVKCRYFFTCVPMALLIVICVAVCIAVIFI